MANTDIILFNVAAFIAALFLLESGADNLISHAATLARLTHTPQALIGLLTAGAEWEELAVVVASLARNRSSLALGNVVGSVISNILGAFSLGLLVHDPRSELEFDASEKFYAALLLAVTTLVAPLLYFPQRIVWLVGGSLLLALFVVYVVSVTWAIHRAWLRAPEDSDSDGDSDSDSDSDEEAVDGSESSPSRTHSDGPVVESPPDPGHVRPLASPTSFPPPNATSPLLRRPAISPSPTQQRRKRSLSSHIAHLILAFLATSLAGYILSHSASTLVDQWALSDVLFGTIILSIATTLPEKFLAVLSGVRGHSGLLVANTAGSNMFLLLLCGGLTLVQSEGDLPQGGASRAELATMWASTALFTLTVCCGGRWARPIGALMLVAYVCFIVLEFAVFYRD